MGYYKWAYVPGHPLANSKGCVQVHRLVAWDAGLLTDPVMVVHHIDGNKRNNALENLEVMTASEHHREHDTLGSIWRAKTHCPKGHEYTPENTRTWRGRRWCRKCDNKRGRDKRAELRKAKA